MGKDVFRKGLVLAIICLFIGAGVVPTISADNSNLTNTWYVDDDAAPGGDGSKDHPFQHIQDGIDVASDNDTVFVYNGTYCENVILNKSINLIGENRDTTTIDGNNTNESLRISSSNSTVSEFTFINGTYGITIIGAYLVNLSDCNVYSNFLDGILLQNSSKNSIIKCNVLNHFLAGIHFECSSKNLIFKCNLIENWRGIQIESSSNYNNISQCNVTNNYWGIKLAESTNTISRCYIMNNTCGIMRGINNYIYYNIFINNSIFHAFGGLEHVNTYDYNYWEGHDCIDNDGDGIGDTPYYIFGANIDWHPLCQPDVLPIIEITFPEKNDFVSGIIIIQGEANDPDGTVTKVEVRIDDGSWETANGTSSWSYEWDTETVDDGKHKIYARSKDNKGYYSPKKSVTVTVDSTSPVVDIVKPREGFVYLKNVEAIPFFMTVVLGGMTVQVDVSKDVSRIDRVEFNVNGELKGLGLWNPIKKYWEWDWYEFRCGLCTLEVVAWDKDGRSGYNEIGLFYCCIRGLPSG